MDHRGIDRRVEKHGLKVVGVKRNAVDGFLFPRLKPVEVPAKMPGNRRDRIATRFPGRTGEKVIRFPMEPADNPSQASFRRQRGAVDNVPDVGAASLAVLNFYPDFKHRHPRGNARSR